MGAFWLVIIVVVGIALIAVLAVSSYQRHARKARARSHAAWAQLQSDVEEIISKQEQETDESVIKPGELPE